MKRLGLLIVTLVILITSCTFYRLGLRYADWLIVREASQVFDLNDLQRSKLKSHTKEQLVWIKQQWLPELIVDIRGLVDRWQDGLSSADHLWFDQELIRLRQTLANHAVPGLALIAVTLSEEQVNHANAALDKRNEKWTGLLKLTDEDLQRKRRDMLEESVESWYGSLSDEQIDTLCDIFGCGRKDLAALVDSSEGFQSSFLKILRTERFPAVLGATLIIWAGHPELMLPKAKQVPWLDYRKNQAQRLAQLDAIMTPKQRKHAIEKTQQIIEDLEWFSHK